MDVKPTVTVTRLELLAPGDLFIFDWRAGGCAAIKVIDPVMNGDKLMLLLGPTFTQDCKEPELIAEQRLSVVSFGKNYTVRLPVNPTEWVISEKPSGNVYVATNGTDVYFRLPCRQGEIFVNLKIGEVCSATPPGILAYTKSWEIVLQEDDTFQVIVKGA